MRKALRLALCLSLAATAVPHTANADSIGDLNSSLIVTRDLRDSAKLSCSDAKMHTSASQEAWYDTRAELREVSRAKSATVSAGRVARLIDRIAQQHHALESATTLAANTCLYAETLTAMAASIESRIGLLSLLPTDASQEMRDALLSGQLFIELDGCNASTALGGTLQIRSSDGSWQDVADAKGWFVANDSGFPPCTTTHPYRPWTIATIPSGAETRWHIWNGNYWSVFSKVRVAGAQTGAAEIHSLTATIANAKSISEATTSGLLNGYSSVIAKDLQSASKLLGGLVSSTVARLKLEASKQPPERTRLLRHVAQAPQIASLEGLSIPSAVLSIQETALLVEGFVSTAKIALRESTITCARANRSQTVTEVSPKCPAGWRKR